MITMARLIQKLIHSAKRFLLFLVCWAICGLVIFVFNQPDKRAVTDFDYFSVCATKLKDDGENYFAKAGEVAYYPLKDINNNPNNFSLCHKPHKRSFINEWHTMSFQKDGDEFYLKTTSDSMGDPFEYWYTIENNTVKPMAHRYGGNMARFVAIMLGWGLAFLPYRLVQLLLRRNKRHL